MAEGYLRQKISFDFRLVESKNAKASANGFSNALCIWINKPHVINRRLCGSRLKYFKIYNRSTSDTTHIELLRQYLSTQAEITGSEKYDCTFFKHEGVNEVQGLSEYGSDDIIVLERDMLPKQPDRCKAYTEIIIYERSEETITFYPKTIVCQNHHFDEELDTLEFDIAYQFMYHTNRIDLRVSSTNFSEDSKRSLSVTWLKDKLLTKLCHWSEEENLKTTLSSLRLLNLEEYNIQYNDLKQKYGMYFVKIWPEKTDPQKFVYEDVAIATYLLLLWKQERTVKNLTEKQSFVDLGCGNGLLVHILSSEGHRGYGVDIRKRKIWDLYGPKTVLKEASVTPSADCLFPDYDWLIGNHSDELTPWIPVIAARSSYTCCYFVLPCCPYDFGSKFNNSQKDFSQYRSYLDYVHQVGKTCGFIVEEDMLRIPSTKRVCFVGRNRSYSPAEESIIEAERSAFIQQRCLMCHKDEDCKGVNSAKRKKDDSESKVWPSDFQPREKVEKIRNCITVSQSTKDHVVKIVFDRVLNCENSSTEQLPDGRLWRRGGHVPLLEVVSLLDREILGQLKSECGGLQTLLRNHSHIFQVSCGEVQLRDFTKNEPYSKRAAARMKDRTQFYKTVPCWFYSYHPDGCPRKSEKCSFAHGHDELRDKPLKSE
ncbi:hypothetical protein CHS0354_022248 [Potamilus streckersoni]|uniref:tRNA (uracil-O(2)-)-methyltransferase n=1 Tax=Potamilus streckersoni TaxID=2493646 RepID=A0AAE0TGY7_9BIVA|nr:hypothetical protein CHS0354_022248 [Potamilus streckersoni]